MNKILTPILIVDDEKDNLEALQRLLRGEFEVTAVTSPVEALKAVQRKEFSVIVSDQRMPEMSGVELLEKIKGIAPFSTRILLTGYTDLDAVINAINRGQIYRYIAKPWDPNELKITLKQAEENYLLRSNLEKKNQELILALNNLSLLDKAKSKFMSLVSHELNTPLTVLVSFSELLAQEKAGLPPTIQKAATAISAATDRLQEIVNEVLHYIKLTSQSEIQKNTIDVVPLLRAVNQQFSPVAQTRKVHLKSECPSSVFISLNPELFSEGLTRCLRAALGQAAPNSSFYWGVKQESDSAVLWFQGEGAALAFEPFSSSGPERHHQKDLGLDLAISKIIFQLHGGAITSAQSASNKFRVEITFSLLDK